MNLEKGPQMPSPEEMAQNEKERTLSDAELLNGGAEYKIDEKGEKRLELTAEQIEKAKKEFEKEQEKEISELTPGKIKVAIAEGKRIEVNAPEHFSAKDKKMYPESRALRGGWEIIDIDESGLVTLSSRISEVQTLPLEELQRYNSETNKEEIRERIREGEEESDRLLEQYDV